MQRPLLTNLQSYITRPTLNFPTTKLLSFVGADVSLSTVVGTVVARVQGSTTNITYGHVASDTTAVDKYNRAIADASGSYNFEVTPVHCGRS